VSSSDIEAIDTPEIYAIIYVVPIRGSLV